MAVRKVAHAIYLNETGVDHHKTRLLVKMGQ